MPDAIADFRRRLLERVTESMSTPQTIELVEELASHYQALYEDALGRGLSADEARRHADQMIGNIADVARVIKRGNPRESGKSFQIYAMAMLIIAALVPTLMQMNGYEIGSLWGRTVEASQTVGLSMLILAGILYAVGLLRARRVVVPALCLALIIIPTVHSLVVLRGKSFGEYDARWSAIAEDTRSYSKLMRPILTERFRLYEVSIEGNSEESDAAIKRLSEIVKRPYDRGAVFAGSKTGKWIFPTGIQKLNGKIPNKNLSSIFFDSTDDFAKARRAWRGADLLLAAMPTIRKGAEAQFSFTENVKTRTALKMITAYCLLGAIPFALSLSLSLLTIGIAKSMSKLSRGRRGAL